MQPGSPVQVHGPGAPSQLLHGDIQVVVDTGLPEVKYPKPIFGEDRGGRADHHGLAQERLASGDAGQGGLTEECFAAATLRD